MAIQSILDRLKDGFDTDSFKDDPLYRDFAENVIPSLKLGDIVYADRFNNEIQKEDMGPRHNYSPFVVLSIDGDKIVAAYCTSNPDCKGAFRIGEFYDLFKPGRRTYTTLLRSKTIDAESHVRKHSKSLNWFDIKRIQKKISLGNTRYTYDDFCLTKDLDLSFDVDFEVGDVVTFRNRSYIVVDVNENGTFKIIPIEGYDPRYSNIDFSKARIEYAGVWEVSRDNLSYVNSLSRPQMDIILANYSDYMRKRNTITESETLARGCLINYADAGLYYVYGVEGKRANAFALKRTNLFDGTISITGRRYMPNYEDVKSIDISGDNFNILGVASEAEMDKIKEAKKHYKKTKEEFASRGKHEKAKTRELQGVLFVCLSNNVTSRYLVCEDLGEVYNAIPVSSLLAGERTSVAVLPKSIVMKTNNITKDELRLIKKNILQVGGTKLSRKLLGDIANRL